MAEISTESGESEMMLRRKLEQEVELKQVMEIQGRRLMSLQLMDLKTQHHHMFPGVPSPRHPHSPFNNQNHFFPQDCLKLDVPEDSNGGKEATIFSSAASNEQISEKSTGDVYSGVDNSDDKEESSNVEDPAQHESFQNILHDHPFASLFKSADDTLKSMVTSNFKQLPPNNSKLGMTSLKSNYFEIPRLSPGQEVAEI